MTDPSIRVFNAESLVQPGIGFILSDKLKLESAFFIETGCLLTIRAEIHLVKPLTAEGLFNRSDQLRSDVLPSITVLNDRFIDIYSGKETGARNSTHDLIAVFGRKAKRAVIAENALFRFVFFSCSVSIKASISETDPALVISINTLSS